MSEECIGGLCWGSRAHAFEPRYDVEPPPNISSTSFNGPAEALFGLVERMTKRTYVRDVCARCGKTIERKP